MIVQRDSNVFCRLVCLPLVEERGLAKRFGQVHLIYKQNVPRWIPRWTPWKGLSE